MTFADKVKSLRTEARMSVRELGRQVGVSAMHISNIENGKSNASPEIVKKIAQALSANADELLMASEQVDPEIVDVINSNPQNIPSFLRAAKNLTPEQWVLIQAQVEELTKDK